MLSFRTKNKTMAEILSTVHVELDNFFLADNSWGERGVGICMRLLGTHTDLCACLERQERMVFFNLRHTISVFIG